METFAANDLSRKGHAFADKTAEKLQGGIHDVRRGVDSAASSASTKVESLRSGAGQIVDETADQAQGVLDKVSAATQRARDFAVGTQDSIVTYTRERPVRALLMAAAAGAILITLVRALTPSGKAS